MKSVIVVLLAVLALANASGNLDMKRVHIFDVYTSPRFTNFLFRSNMPVNNSAFDYSALKQAFAQRAREANLTFPSDFYLIDLSLNNDFDGEEFKREKDFWAKAPKTLGEFVNWPLGLAGILPPSFYTDEERRKLVNGTLWDVDKIPERIATVNNWLRTGRPDKALVILVHCTAGCDRTGEFIGSYRIQYKNYKTVQMFNQNCAECGRCPNYWSATALEWFCFTYQYREGKSIGDCMDFADCKMFGQCQSKHPNTTVAAEPLICITGATARDALALV